MLQIRRRFGRGAVVAAASAAVVASAAGIAVASASVPHITTATTLRLEARGGTSTFVNVRHLSRPAVGDEVILAQPVYSAAHPSQLVGHGVVTVIFVAPPRVSQDHATLVLKNGQIDAAGVEASNPFQLAVTGGTGQYQNARGQATVKLLPGPGNKALITVSLLP